MEVPPSVSFPFRTVRIGTKKAYSLGKSQPLKFDQKRLKFSIKFGMESSVEDVKLIIPSKHIIKIKSFLGRGCPVIWFQTSEEYNKNMRKALDMKKGPTPSPYYDPESNVSAERHIGIVIDLDPIPYTEAYEFKRVVKEISAEHNVREDNFHEFLSNSDCNAILVDISAYGDKLISFSKKLHANPQLDIKKCLPLCLRESVSYVPEVASTSQKATKEVPKEDFVKMDNSPEPLAPTEPPPLIESPLPKNVNRARKSVPKSKLSLSLDNQLSEIRAKAGIGSSGKAVPIINIDEMKNLSSPDTSSQPDAASDDASSSASAPKRTKAKDPLQRIWKPKVKKRYKKSSGHPQSGYGIKTSSLGVGESLHTPLSTISASSTGVAEPQLPGSGTQQTEETLEQISGRAAAVEKCRCLKKSPHIVLTGIEPIKCMGLDCVDGRLSKCIYRVETPMMMRASRRSPLLALCEEHRERMLRHECCPGCGMFCAGGTYLICVNVPECPHRFHRDCMLLYRQTKICLHCSGPMSKIREVTVEPRQDYKLRWVVAGLDPNKMEKKKLLGNRQKTARMGHRSALDIAASDDGVEKMLRPGLIVNTAGLRCGKDREMLEEALCSFFEASHQKMKIHPKNVSQVIQQGDLMKLIQFLHEAEDHDVRNLLKNPSTLTKAVINSNVAIAYLLGLVKVKVNAKDGKGKTALFYAEEQEHVILIDYLIEIGADFTIKDNEGMTCMHRAAMSGRIVSCAALMGHSRDVVNLPDEGGWTPIVWATEHKHTSTAKYLEHFGANVMKADKEGNSCLHWAALSGNLDLIIMCLQKHADINLQNLLGDTALHVATRQDHTECVLCLVNWGADYKIRNNERKTALECAFPNTDTEALLKFKYKAMEAMLKPAQTPYVKERTLSSDLSKGFENLPVSCVNSVDNAPCPTASPDGFHYVMENVHTTSETIVKNPTNKMQSCYCYNECSDGSCLCGVMSSRCWYNKSGQLIPEFDFVDAPYIVECSETCWCPAWCHNRVVQKGIKYRLQVHRTRGMGWSVRTLDTIPRGAFVCEYVGELISDAEADIREDDSYLFDLENSDGEIFCIDARYYGNVSRFINHLCDPNLMPLRVFIDHHDKRFPRLAYFSTKEIKVGEELGFDYGNRFWDVKCRSFTCGCGSAECKYSEEAYRLRKERESKEKSSEVPAPTVDAKDE